MKQTKVWVDDFLKSLTQKGPQLVAIFDDLVYGKSFDCIYNKKRANIVMYLNEDVPQMLVGVPDSNTEIYFNLREARLLANSSKHQLEMKVRENSYLVIQQDKEEVIFMYEGENEEDSRRRLKEKEIFFEFLKFYRSQLAKSPFQMESLLLYTFISVDKNQNMTLESSEINYLLSRLRMKENQQFQAIVNFVRKEQDANDGEITFNEFQRIMKLMQCRLQFKPTYEKISHKKIKSLKYYMEKNLSIQDFTNFLKNDQGEGEAATEIAETYFAKQQRISFYDFSKFMVSQYTSAFNRSLQQASENLTLPLTQYYCFSSHNTYLTGNQLTSDSRAIRYRDDLQNGYRCLEIDVHNGDKEPIVKHGFTMTSSITFREVIETIAKYSNENQKHTPIILSLQNHANQKQQAMIAAILLQNLGDKIVRIQPNIKSNKFPTLQSTLGKIIIKNPGNFLQYQMCISQSSNNQLSFQGQANSQDEEEKQTPSLINASYDEYPADVQQHLKQFNDIQCNLQREKREFIKSQLLFKKSMGRRDSEIRTQVGKKSINPELLKLTAMLSNGSLKRPCIWESNSLSQGMIKNYFLNNFKLLREWTEEHWVRAYPSASRVDSSNYNPITALQLGVQLVALNSQSDDHYLATMRNFFRRGKNKTTGYRLKKSPDACERVDVQISPISCFMISSLVDPSIIPEIQVKMRFLGSAFDMFQNQMYTKMDGYTQVIKGNAYNPIFQNVKIMQLKISKPEFAFVLFQISNCGRGVISIQGLKRGYRYSALLDSTLQQRKSKVFFKID